MTDSQSFSVDETSGTNLTEDGCSFSKEVNISNHKD